MLIQIDYVHFYVDDARKWRNWFVEKMGFESLASGSNEHTHLEIVAQGDLSAQKIHFLLSSPLNLASPVADYLQLHSPGIADVAFTVADLELVIKKACTWGIKLLQPLEEYQFPQGKLQWSKVKSIAGIEHTLIQRDGVTPLLPYNWLNQQPKSTNTHSYFTKIDHLVLNVAAGDLESTINWYEQVFGFQRKQNFRIATDQSGLYSQVMIHPLSGVQIPVNEPLSPQSQIQEFLDLNRGAGIQHLALKTNNIIHTNQQLRTAGITFLEVPQSYYFGIQNKYKDLPLSPQEWQQVIEQQILLDYSPNKLKNYAKYPLLLQIFTEPIFAEPTFFFELIERRNEAKGFGEGNFRALFEAIEREQIKRGSLG